MRRMGPEEKQHLWVRLDEATHGSMKGGLDV